MVPCTGRTTPRPTKPTYETYQGGPPWTQGYWGQGRPVTQRAARRGAASFCEAVLRIVDFADFTEARPVEGVGLGGAAPWWDPGSLGKSVGKARGDA